MLVLSQSYKFWANNSFLKWRLCLLAGILFSLHCTAFPVQAELPVGYQTASGTATFQNDGTTLTINASNKAIINYGRFNIGSGQSVNILSPLSLHRVTGGNPSQILGNLNSTGKVFLINPSGILFGQGSKVNVQGLVASTLDIQDDDFLAGKYNFLNPTGNVSGSIVNHGQVQANESIALLSGAIRNTGTLQAPQVRLAVGDQITYFANPEVGIDVLVGAALKRKVDGFQSAIANTGSILGQDVRLQARLAQAFYETTVNNEGVIKAQGLAVNEVGRIVAIGQSDDGLAIVHNAGTMAADGHALHANGGELRLEGDIAVNTGTMSVQGSATGVGGSVLMLGNTVQNSGNAEINASGGLGGGSILVGGDYQGNNSAIRNALYNISTGNARFLANALTNGNGGKVILWANNKTVFLGDIQAKGGLMSGNGGFVETSGKNILQALGKVDAGRNGQWLLDPNNINIANSFIEQFISMSGTNPLLIQSTDDTARVLSGTIQAALNNGTDVTIQTTSSGSNTDFGDITIDGGTSILKTAGGDATLTLKANRSINFNGGTGINLITVASSGAGNKVNIVLNADTDQGSDGGIGGGIALQGTDLTTNGGNLTFGGGADPYTQSAIGTNLNTNLSGITLGDARLNAGTGNIILNGIGQTDPVESGRSGIILRAGTILTTTSGNITLNGTSGFGADRNYGVYLEGSSLNTRVETQNGNIVINAQAKGTGVDNRGLVMDRSSKIISTGSGNITVHATGGNGTISNNGIFIDGNGISGNLTGITSVDGDINITAAAGVNATSDSNRGIHLVNGVQIASTGSGNIAITATGGGGTNNNTGIYADGYGSAADYTADISTNTGDITVVATGGNGSQWNNHGIQLNNGSVIKSASGNVSLTGTGKGTNGNDNYGVHINGNNNATKTAGILSQSGNVTIFGQGGGTTTNNNHGVYVEQGGAIYSAGAGNVSITGIKGAGTSNSIYTNNGSNILGNNSQTGNLTLRADDYTLNNVQLRTAGKLIYQPYTDNLSVGLNGGAGTFQINTSGIYSLIDRSIVTPSALVFGNANTANGLVTIGNNWNLSTLAMPVEVHGGSILTNSISMGNNRLLMQARNGNLTINSGSVLNSNATGNAIVLAASQNFINNAGNSAINNPNGRWLIYSSDPATTTEGFSSYTKRYNRTFAANTPGSVLETGNVFLYSIAPTITITANDATRLYGSANPTFSGSVSAGLIDGDTAAAAYSGAADFTTLATNASDAGTYAIAPGAGTLSSTLGYQFVYNQGTLTVDKAPLLIRANDISRQQGSNSPPFTASYTGFVLGQDETALNHPITLSTIANNNSPVGSYAITASGNTAHQNYDITLQNGTLTLTPNLTPAPSTVNTSPTTVPYLLSPLQTPNTMIPQAFQQQQQDILTRASDFPDDSQPTPLLKIASTTIREQKPESSKQRSGNLEPEGLFPELLKRLPNRSSRK